MIDKKIEEILGIAWRRGCADHEELSDLTKDLTSIFKEYAMEIIGKDEDPTIYGVWNPLSAKGVKIEKKIMDDKDTLVRNKLRAEQREKLLTEDKK